MATEKLIVMSCYRYDCPAIASPYRQSSPPVWPAEQRGKSADSWWFDQRLPRGGSTRPGGNRPASCPAPPPIKSIWPAYCCLLLLPSAALESTCCFHCCARCLLCHSIRSKPAQGCSEVVLPPECFFRVQELSNLASQWGIRLPVKARSNYIVQFFCTLANLTSVYCLVAGKALLWLELATSAVEQMLPLARWQVGRFSWRLLQHRWCWKCTHLCLLNHYVWTNHVTANLISG